MKKKLATVCVLISILSFSSAENVREATATIVTGNGTSAVIKFSQEAPGADVFVTGTVNVSASVDTMVGIHIHEFGDVSSEDCMSTKSHWNPNGMMHGSANSSIRHIGDLGNVNVSLDGSGQINLQLPADLLPLVGPNSIVGRALVIHEKKDDLGQGDEWDSNSTGHAGSPLGCAVIGITSDFSSASLDPGMDSGHSRLGIRKAVAVIRSPDQEVTYGVIHFAGQSGDSFIRISGTLTDVWPYNAKHGMHVHPFGTTKCDVAGGRMSDMGNVEVDSKGTGHISMVSNTDKFPFVGLKSIIGRTLILHEGDHENSGARLGCGVIGIMNEFSPADTDSPMKL